METQVNEMKVSEDLGFCICLKTLYKNDNGENYVAVFACHKIESIDESAETLTYFYEDKNKLNELTSVVSDAKETIQMSIKWDGCSHLNIPYIHNCDERSVMNTLKVIQECWAWALEVLPDLKDYR